MYICFLIENVSIYTMNKNKYLEFNVTKKSLSNF